ncbi:MAG: Nif3-like dinuclear metal center hexameric protein [Bacteroidota bacterium]
MKTSKHFTRREFVHTSMATIGASSLIMGFTRPEAGATGKLTIQQIIQLILKEIPGAPFDKTVDTVKIGNPDVPVTGIVTTMFATVDVIRKAIEIKANFIIAHEPTFYNHLDETAWLGNDPIYQYKRELLLKNNMVVWRFHDYWHSHRPDGIMQGVLEQLGWEKFSRPEAPFMIAMKPTLLGEIIDHVKSKLGIPTIRFMGNPSQACKLVALIPGAAGGKAQIQTLMSEKPDVLICGELAEWETSEYIRDAMAMGVERSLIVLGHAVSEEPGMLWLAQWLQPKVSGIPVTHVPSNNPFSWA